MAAHCLTRTLRKELRQIFRRVGSSCSLHVTISKLHNVLGIVKCSRLVPERNKPQFIETHHRCYGTQSSRSEPVTLEAEDEDTSETEVLQSEAADRIKSLSPEMEKKLKVIKLEYEVMLHSGETVAENMTDSMWMQLFDCETKSARRRMHVYFRKREKYKLAKERKRAVRLEQHEERRIAFETGEIEKAPLNTFLLRLRKKTTLTYHNSRLANAMLYGSPLLIDLGFEDSMKQREIINLSEQLMLGHGFNKAHKDPFHMIFCNVSQDSGVVKSMQRQSGLLPLEEYMFTMSEKSYLDLYPHNNLVYLTPNAKDVMTKYDYDKVYILGGIVDKTNPKPFTMAKAKREGITMQKLPLDYYHKWEKGTKSLTLDQMIRILLDIHMTQNWFEAFRHLPARKIIQDKPAHGRTF